MLLIFGSKNTGPIQWISIVDGIASSLGAHLKTSTAGHVKHDDVNLQGAQAHGLAMNSHWQNELFPNHSHTPGKVLQKARILGMVREQDGKTFGNKTGHVQDVYRKNPEQYGRTLGCL